jgi:hypothetical protein
MTRGVAGCNVRRDNPEAEGDSMLKAMLLAATLGVAASTTLAANPEPAGAGATPADDAPCRLVQSLDLACAMRVVDANGDGTLSASELAGFAAPLPPIVDWAPLRPQHSALDFRDAATEPAPLLSATLDNDGSRRLVPALFALGALVILLRGRPT